MSQETHSPSAGTQNDRIQFSIVIDNYNYGRFLVEAIESCLNQTYAPREIIIVDDGSTDGSRAILSGYADNPRIRVLLQSNQGQAAALQHGFDLATGDWILGLDSDDYYKEECLEEIARHIDDSVDWLYFRATDVDSSSRPIGCRPDLGTPLLEGSIWKQWIEKGHFHTFPPQSFHCYSARFLRSITLYPNCRVGQKTAMVPDRYVNLLASFNCKAIAIASELGCYREHNSDYKRAARTLPGIRAKLKQQLIAEEIVAEKMEELRLSLRPRFCVYSPYDYWPERLISLIDDPLGHPFPNDSRFSLLLHILSAYADKNRFRPLGLLRASFQYSFMAFLPRALAWRIFRLPSTRSIREAMLGRISNRPVRATF